MADFTYDCSKRSCWKDGMLVPVDDWKRDLKILAESEEDMAIDFEGKVFEVEGSPVKRSDSIAFEVPKASWRDGAAKVLEKL